MKNELSKKSPCHLVFEGENDDFYKNTIWLKAPPSYCERKEDSFCTCCPQCCTCGG